MVNLLKDHLEVKVSTSGSGSTKQQEQICGGRERPVNFMLAACGSSGTSTTSYQLIELRTKLLGQSAGEWSMPVNLTLSHNDPLIMKLPVKDGSTSSSCSIWLHILQERNASGLVKLLVIFTPMYVMQSCVPGTLYANIHTKAIAQF